MDRIVVVLGSGTITASGQLRYAVFSSSKENLIDQEDIEYLNAKLQTATIVQGSLHKALILADFEADVLADGGPLPGILIHDLKTCRISPDNLTIEAI